MIQYSCMNNPDSTKVLVVAPDVVGKKMAGPGMRYVEIAKVLSEYFSVLFAIGVEGSENPDFKNKNITTQKYKSIDDLKRLVDQCDVIFCQFIDTNAVLYALSAGKKIIYDLYNVLPIETIAAERISGYEDDADKNREFKELLKYFSFCAKTGSFFVTSNERQRDFWLGYIMSNRTLLPSSVNKQTTNSDIIGLVPFGMESVDPVQKKHGLRGQYGITNSDIIYLWCGGIWDWFDAETPIRAIADLSKKYSNIKLVFYGTSHPNKDIGTPKNVTRAINLAKQLNVYQTNVIFYEGWVPASERADFLLDADVAISTHLKSLETRYAFRTRILDHFWAKLPTIATKGDWFTEYIENNRLGIGVDYKDIEDVKSAILEMSKQDRRDEICKNISQIRNSWRWKSTTKPLVNAIANQRELVQKTTPRIEKTPYITFSGYAKQSKGIKQLKQTPVWPIMKKIHRRIR